MEFKDILSLVGDEPVFETGFLLSGGVNPRDVHRQLSRWTAAGRLLQLRRGLYTLAPPFQKIKPHPFLIANHLQRASYVSCQSALAYYGLIPEHVPVVVSVSTTRPYRWETPLGSYEYRHVKRELFFAYQLIAVGEAQQAFVATPEKALIDLVYLQPGGDSSAYLRELRLQNLERFNREELRSHANRLASPKLRRAVAIIEGLAHAEAEEYESI